MSQNHPRSPDCVDDEMLKQEHNNQVNDDDDVKTDFGHRAYVKLEQDNEPPQTCSLTEPGDGLTNSHVYHDQELHLNQQQRGIYNEFDADFKTRIKMEPHDPESSNDFNDKIPGPGHEFENEHEEMDAKPWTKRDVATIYPVKLSPSACMPCIVPEGGTGCKPTRPEIVKLVRAQHNFMSEETPIPLDLRQLRDGAGLLKIEVNDPLHPVAGEIMKDDEDIDQSPYDFKVVKAECNVSSVNF
jgi:hypothetical protein